MYRQIFFVVHLGDELNSKSVLSYKQGAGVSQHLYLVFVNVVQRVPYSNRGIPL